ncbi:MAG: hypothetical protein K0S33_2912 [Bacteroidetes bacterium]|jgi:hypothetical protein|nr:hypothetical protein [Bacteroidota bacterium]
MKQMVKMFAIAIVVAVLGFACSKKEITPQMASKNVVLEIALQPGETYNLDLSSYSAKSSIIKQTTNAAESRLTEGTCQVPAKYSYTAGSVAASDQVVLQITKKGKCKNDPEEMTTITVNITVASPPTTGDN